MRAAKQMSVDVSEWIFNKITSAAFSYDDCKLIRHNCKRDNVRVFVANEIVHIFIQSIFCLSYTKHSFCNVVFHLCAAKRHKRLPKTDDTTNDSGSAGARLNEKCDSFFCRCCFEHSLFRFNLQRSMAFLRKFLHYDGNRIIASFQAILWMHVCRTCALIEWAKWKSHWAGYDYLVHLFRSLGSH